MQSSPFLRGPGTASRADVIFSGEILVYKNIASSRPLPQVVSESEPVQNLTLSLPTTVLAACWQMSSPGIKYSDLGITWIYPWPTKLESSTVPHSSTSAHVLRVREPQYLLPDIHSSYFTHKRFTRVNDDFVRLK